MVRLMGHKYPVVTIFGGSGFLGRSVVQDIAKLGYTIKIASRAPQSAYELRTAGKVGQIVPVLCTYTLEDINHLVEGSDYVINLVGILSQSGKNSFERIHKELPANIAKACAKNGVQKFVHVSALGVDENQARYAQTKKAAEELVLDIFPKTTILRPSVVFGPEDDFFNRFAKMAEVSPFLPLIGGGQTKFQPVFVGDVAAAVTKTLDDPGQKTTGRIYEIAGPDILSFKECLELMFHYTHNPRSFIKLPFFVAKLIGIFASIVPNPPITKDQVTSLKFDNIETGRYGTLSDLGITPKGLSGILPTYLSQYVPGGPYAVAKKTNVQEL